MYKVFIEICIKIIRCKFHSPIHLFKQCSLLSWIFLFLWWVWILRFSFHLVFLTIIFFISMFAYFTNTTFAATTFTVWATAWAAWVPVRRWTTATIIMTFARSLWSVRLWCVVWNYLVLNLTLIFHSSRFDVSIWSSLEIFLVSNCFCCLFCIFCQRLLFSLAW